MVRVSFAARSVTDLWAGLAARDSVTSTWRDSSSAASASRSTATVPAHIRTWRTPSACAAPRSWSGSSPPGSFNACTSKATAEPASTTAWPSRASRTSAPGFSAATCSARCAAPGWTSRGRAGGATSLGGGVATVRQYLQAGLIDEMHLALRPVLIGEGEHLLRGLDLRTLGYDVRESIAGERATHMIVARAR